MMLLFLLAVVIRSATSWQKIEVGKKAEWLFMGRRLGKQAEEGWRWIIFKGLFSLKEVETRIKTLEIVMTDLFARSGTPKTGEPVESVPRVRMKASGLAEYYVINTFRFLGLGGLDELKKLMEGVALDVLRQEFQGRDLGEILDKTHQQAITDAVREGIRKKAVPWGVRVNDFFLRPLKVEDPDVERAMQSLFREREERTAEVYEAGTIASQATVFLCAVLGITDEQLERWRKGDFQGSNNGSEERALYDKFRAELRQEIPATKDWRIKQDAVRSNKGAVVILPAGMEMSYRPPQSTSGVPRPTREGGGERK